MRRIVVVALVAAGLGVPRPAEAAADPLAAVKAQYVPGRGVMVREMGHSFASVPAKLRFSQDGWLEFGRSRVVAYEMRVKLAPAKERVRSLGVGKYTYRTSPAIVRSLPKGKIWRAEPKEYNPLRNPVFVVEPTTLKALLKTVTRHNGGFYEGVIAYGDLYAASPSLRADAPKPDELESAVDVKWHMYTGAQDLPNRFCAKVDDQQDAPGRDTCVQFLWWGAKKHLPAPPASRVGFPAAR
ncbi:hypothetical protein Aple_081890 [Acrocarpospora pleiomorpha]|uniref:Uncharacterized protein n=1 Tax=Acrocarpospora pleiomorpha TaxID=90975 RepID=A0A5M3XWF9_9ACTN|nr:hypothetical protein [Acrocarpospora pleiomorpha]GES25290.1 hypothetical protein Aple_081890 [Acrocarpospora pleiomorpha]